jgi:tetratricopeptide (TPR) repeat protein
MIGCDRRGEAQTASSGADAPLKSSQGELLDLAFGAASALPVDPHIKDRSRLQEAVVAACLELGQPQRAFRYLEQIGDWRRGAAYAALAFYCARHGVTRDVQSYLDRAAQAAQQAGDWQKDRIKAKIAQVHAYLGRTADAAKAMQGVGPTESGKVARAEAMVCSADSFGPMMEALEKLIATGQFDTVKNALEAHTELFDRFYEDRERRARVEERIKASWSGLPDFVRIELLTALVGSALAHGDQSKALELVNEAKTILDSVSWQPQLGIPVMAKLAELRFRAGDRERARADAQEALKLFDTKRDTIVNIYRAQVLRAIAEAYQGMGDTGAAQEIYGRALEAGTENPNSRPRAEDLAGTCCSMAVHAVEPSPGLWNRIREIRNRLGDPW